MRLLLVEDNDRLSELIATGLAREGFQVDRVGSIADGLSALGSTHFAAIVLDLGLPDGDGLSIVQALRARGSTTPVLILTARQGLRDRVYGLEQGADDYLAKPFAMEELIARLRALLRRPATWLGRELSLGRLAFDTESREMVFEDRHVAMGSREAILLEMLLRRAGNVVSKKVMEDQLYGLSEEGSSNAVEVSVHRLRRQLEDLDAGVAIHTVRGVGYLIRQEPA